MRWDVSSFRRSLDELFEFKKTELTRFLETPPGRPPNDLDRETRDALIEDALGRAEDALYPMAKSEFKSLTSGRTYARKRPRLNRNGPLSSDSWDRIGVFLDGFYDSLETSRQIYLFWRGNDCLYVGQTKNDVWGGGGKWRTDLWRECTHVQILSTDSKRDLGKLECLAVHVYRPKYNKYKPPIRYYGTRCPVHEVLSPIRSELETMFSLRA
ncbi:MAG: hypothetical protein HY247_08420 [archaeon]|nr:MAG: hypothetical protein HY247_08420 [archaeon]